MSNKDIKRLIFMKQIIIILISAFSINSFSQIDTININGFDFIFKHVKNAYTDDIENTSVNLLRLETSGNTKYLLKHTMDLTEGDCNSTSVEMGDYLIKDTTIIFYSFWCRQGDAPVSPWGARIQEYNISENGNVKMASSKLYIETSRPDWHENKGIKYLFENSKTKEEKIALKEYIESVEKEYNAKFVYGIESDKLLREVKQKFSKQIELLLKDWKEIENSFSYKI